LRGGVTIDGTRYGAIEATLDRVQGSNLWLTFAIREGKKREVRNVLGHCGLTVNRLIRTSFGPFQLGDLAEGAVEEVRTRVLREQLGERVIALAGADFSAPIVAQPAAEKKEGARRTERQEPTRQKSKSRELPSDKSASREPISHKPVSHTWRPPAQEAPAKKLRRKFRGSRRGEKRPARSEGEPRAGLLTDRKGRRVLVERFGQPPVQALPERETRNRPHRPSGKRPYRRRGR